jgi:peptidoglycan hydrolase CwlO-like protein
MGKFLVILSIILTAASAVLGYLNRSKLDEARKSLIDSETAGNQAKTQLAKAQGDLKTVSQERDTAVSERDQTGSKLSAAQGELERAKGQVAAPATTKPP